MLSSNTMRWQSRSSFKYSFQKVKRAFSSSRGNRITELPWMYPAVSAHTMLPATEKQVNVPHLNPSHASWYSIYLPRRDVRLSWPRWLVIYWDGLPAHRRSPMQVLTGPNVQQLRWLRPTQYQKATSPHNVSKCVYSSTSHESWIERYKYDSNSHNKTEQIDFRVRPKLNME